jgi:hypothetical protein
MGRENGARDDIHGENEQAGAEDGAHDLIELKSVHSAALLPERARRIALPGGVQPV